MTLVLLVQTVVTLIFAGKFLAAGKFIMYRLASWLGVGFFYKRGKESGKKKFYWVAFVVWLVSWTLVIIFTPTIWRHAVSFFRR